MTLGVVKNSSWSSIKDEMLDENPSTCFLMYARKALLDHRPIIMMVKVGTRAKCIAIAAPDLIECVPMSSRLKPRVSNPIAFTVTLRAFLMTVEVR